MTTFTSSVNGFGAALSTSGAPKNTDTPSWAEAER
jgi:hypothetical protein